MSHKVSASVTVFIVPVAILAWSVAPVLRCGGTWRASMAAENRQGDLRGQVSRAVLNRLDILTADAVAILPHTGQISLDRDFCERLANSLIRLLALAVRDAAVDERGMLVAQLRGAVLERSLETGHLFTLAYLVERTVIDELALDETIGATTEAWPVVAQLVRRASFEYLALFGSRTHFDSSGTFTDALTTLHTRAMLDAVLLKETDRAGRFGHPLALILFDVDRLATINDQHGYGVGTRLLERLGILMRTYFRQHDWVARYGDDEIAVLLTGPDAGHAAELAERARQMVEARLAFTDHRKDQLVPVTISAAVIHVDGVAGTTIDPERLLVTVEAALQRAKQTGRNRVETIGGVSVSRTLPRSSPSV
jgi:diguanylate cyclase (GGDEF)-like protein